MALNGGVSRCFLNSFLVVAFMGIQLPGFFGHPALLVFSLAGLFLTLLGFIQSVFLWVLGGVVLLLGYLGFGILLGSHVRFVSRFSTVAQSARVSEPAQLVRHYLVTAMELELGVLLIGAGLLMVFIIAGVFPVTG